MNKKMKLINAHDLAKAYMLKGKDKLRLATVINEIEMQPMVDAALITHAKWIPVEERLPKTSGTMREDEKLLILLPDGMRTVSFYISTSSGRKMFFDGWDTYNPIAWMPLPEPYKEAEE